MSDDATPDLSSLLFTRAPLALSRTQRLVSTWLPPPTAEELAERTKSTETQREEDETFMPSTELYITPRCTAWGRPCESTRRVG